MSICSGRVEDDLLRQMRVEKPVLLYAGRLSEEKGVGDFIDALAIVKRRGLLCTGLILGDGPLRERLERQVRDLGLADRVRLLPAVGHSEMPRYYRCADVVVVPSRTTGRIVEQFGRTIIEGLASGRPIVGSSAGEVPLLLERTGGGLVFPEGDIETFAECLGRLVVDGASRERLAGEGRAAVLRDYSSQAEAAALARMYRSILHEREPRGRR